MAPREYASAIRKGAPQAQQVSDRWHLVKNLAACVSVQIAKTLAQLRRTDEWRPAQTPAVQQAQQARQAERMARYEHILELQKHGMKSAEMARTLGMSQRTLQRWIATGTIPYARRKRPRASLLDPGHHLSLEARASGVSHGSTTGKRTALQRVQRVATRDLSVSADVESIDPCSLQAQECSQACFLDPAPCALDALGITGQPFSFSADQRISSQNSRRPCAR